MVLVVAAAASLAGPAVAIAGSPPSASNSQYVDPLANLPKPKTTTHTTTTTATTTTITVPSAGLQTTSPPAVSSDPTATTANSTTDPPGTLPHTGYSLWEVTLLGMALAGAGTALRRRVD